ncbi:hypothetical protein [Bradyrhizobium sp. 1]|uniref:hypothetical protein n=1 Tax=Bradyrhizobium sp. 1 TaxID=241591 RepID=UPI001FF7D3B5|nr:hypothetical protein [Bradyrhizobium sp. 1]MCK1393926.1 phosphotransferase [Bradyrhizobium sp. 1]
MNIHLQDSHPDVKACVEQALKTCTSNGSMRNGGSAPNLRRLTSGTGSLALFYVSAEPSVVIKIGANDVMREETEFFEAARVFTKSAPLIDFPVIYCRSVDRSIGWFAMEAGKDVTIENDLYDDKGELRDGWVETLNRFADCMSPVYRDTLTTEAWNLDRYHLEGRTRALLTDNQAMRINAARIAGLPPFTDIVNSRVAINGRALGSPLGMLDEAVSRMRGTTAPCSFIHGDLQLRNVIPSEQHEGFLLIDPRASWEGKAPHVAFHGSPLYDAANVLHSVAGLSPILIKKERNQAAALSALSLDRSRLVLDLDDRYFASTDAAIEMAEECVATMLPASLLDHDWRIRFYLYAANSCFGWLRSQTVVSELATWALIYATGIRMLGRAAR